MKQFRSTGLRESCSKSGVLVVLLVVFLATKLEGQTASYHLKGTVTLITTNDGAIDSRFNVGDEFELRFAVNRDATDTYPHPDLAIYEQAITQVDATLLRDGDRYYEITQSGPMLGSVEIWDEPFDPPFIDCCTDQLIYDSTEIQGEDVGGWRPQQLTWTLSAWTDPRPLLSTEPPEAIDPSQFDSTSWSLRFRNVDGVSVAEVAGEISSIELVQPAPPFRIAEVDYLVGSDEISLTWPSGSGESFVIEGSSDLTEWTPISGAIPSDGAATLNRVLPVSDYTFFRVVRTG